MHNQKKINKKSIAVVILIAFFLFTRLPRLNSDEINPDGVNWHYRMQQFVVGLKTLQLEKTYQHYHPGVTLMWIAGVPVEIYKQLSGEVTYNMNNFQTFHLVAKLSVVTAQLLLTLLALILLSKILGFKTSFLVISLLSLEPFFVGNSRLFHMDVLFTLFMLNALLFVYLSIKQKSYKYAALSGLFLTFTFLTKSIGVTLIFYVVFASLIYFILNREAKFSLKFYPILIGSLILSLFLFFPAMFKGPLYYLSEIFNESERVGVRNGHGQIVLGEYTEGPGLGFYPLVLLLKTSPFALLGIVFFVIFGLIRVYKKEKFSVRGFSFYLGAYYVLYFLTMSVFSKKIDRYMVPVYPFVAYLSVSGYLFAEQISNKYRKLFNSFLILIFLVFIAYPNFKLFPYLFTYTNPLLGSPVSANKIIAQKPFGIGIFDLKNALVNKYGEKTKLGFYDVKPIEAIYPNSQVFDIRETGPGSYDLIVLGINEVMPEKILSDSRFKFERDFSLNINGLEYWRVYAKKSK